MCVLPDSLMRRSDAILVLTSGLNREVAAGKGLEPAACVSDTLSVRASSPVRVFVCACAGCVCRLAASDGGCNTLDPRFIFQRVSVCVCKKRGSQNSDEKSAREKEEEKEEEEEGRVAKIRQLCFLTYGSEESMIEKQGETEVKKREQGSICCSG